MTDKKYATWGTPQTWKFDFCRKDFGSNAFESGLMDAWIGWHFCQQSLQVARNFALSLSMILLRPAQGACNTGPGMREKNKSTKKQNETKTKASQFYILCVHAHIVKPG